MYVLSVHGVDFLVGPVVGNIRKALLLTEEEFFRFYF